MAAKPFDIIIQPRFVQIGGDLVVGALLSQLYFWCVAPDKKGHSKLRVFRDGYWWAAKTREELMRECGITRKQYLRAMAVLKEKGIVVVKLYRSRYHGGNTVNHVRIVVSKLERALELTDVTKGDNGVYPKGTTGCTLKGQPSIHQHLHQTLTCKPGSFAAPGEGLGKANPAGGEGKEEEKKKAEKDEVKLEENTIMDAKQAVEKVKQRAEQGNLQLFWKKRMETVTGKFQHDLTAKEKGQLKLIANAIGEQTKLVIDYILNDWAGFRFTVEVEKGWKKTPIAPDLGFLLQHKVIAHNLYLQSIAQPVAKAPVKVYADDVNFQVKEVKETPMTEEEFWQVLKESNEG